MLVERPSFQWFREPTYPATPSEVLSVWLWSAIEDCFIALDFVGAFHCEHVRCIVSWDVTEPINPLDGGLYLTPVVEFIGSYQDISDNRLFVVRWLV